MIKTISNFLVIICFIIIIPIVTITSCSYDSEEALYSSPAEITDNCDTTNVTYTIVIKSFLDNQCATTGCHNPGSVAPDLSTFESASSSAQSIYTNAATSTHQSRFTWSNCERKQLYIWSYNPVY